jgi:hypothetical protein
MSFLKYGWYQYFLAASNKDRIHLTGVNSCFRRGISAGQADNQRAHFMQLPAWKPFNQLVLFRRGATNFKLFTTKLDRIESKKKVNSYPCDTLMCSTCITLTLRLSYQGCCSENRIDVTLSQLALFPDRKFSNYEICSFGTGNTNTGIKETPKSHLNDT